MALLANCDHRHGHQASGLTRENRLPAVAETANALAAFRGETWSAILSARAHDLDRPEFPIDFIRRTGKRRLINRPKSQSSPRRIRSE
jgi:hypothetical protein